MTTVAYPHIEVAQDGVPYVEGTTTKVVEIVLDRLAHHWDAEEIHRQHPHLALAQIYSALAYYHDHQSEIDADIARRLEKVDKIAEAQPESAVRARLRAQGRLR